MTLFKTRLLEFETTGPLEPTYEPTYEELFGDTKFAFARLTAMYFFRKYLQNGHINAGGRWYLRIEQKGLYFHTTLWQPN